MIAETALVLAGDRAHLVSRPRGVAHVFTGSLSRAGSVPCAARPLCRAHTRRLRSVNLPERWTSLNRDAAALLRVCARCAACLDRARNRSRQATSSAHVHRSRGAWAQEYAGCSRADLAAALYLATSPGEVDAAAWLTLLLFGLPACRESFTEHGRDWPPLEQLVREARSRVHGFPENPLAPAIAANRAAGDATRKSRAREVAQERRHRRGLTGEDRDHAPPR